MSYFSRELLYKYYSFIQNCFQEISEEEVISKLKNSLESNPHAPIYHILLKVVLEEKGDPKRITIEPIRISLVEISRGDLYVTFSGRIHSKREIETQKGPPLRRALVYDNSGWTSVEFGENLDTFNSLHTGGDYTFTNFKNIRTSQRENHQAEFQMNSQVSPCEFPEGYLTLLNSKSFYDHLSFTPLGEVHSSHNGTLNLRNIRVISKELRSFKKKESKKGFTHYTIADASGHLDFIDWDNKVNLMRGDTITLLFVSSRYYAPRNTSSITLNPYSILQLEDPGDHSISDVFKPMSLHQLFTETLEETDPLTNFVSLQGRFVIINGVSRLESRTNTEGFWRIQATFDDTTGATKMFLPLSTVTHLLPPGRDYLAMTSSRSSLIRGVLEESLLLREFRICGRVNRYQVPVYRAEPQVYFSIFVEEAIEEASPDVTVLDQEVL